MWIKTSSAIVFVGSISACDTPSPAYRGVPAQTVTIGHSEFHVRRIGDTVELLRVNTEYAPTFASIIPRATQAVIVATGCPPDHNSWEGEQTLMQVDLDCD